MNIPPSASSLSESHPFITQDGRDFLGLQPEEWQVFARRWESLETDKYLKDGGTYRLRRYGAVIYNSATNSYEALPEESGFFQSLDHNPMNGGIVRKFAPLSNETLLDPSLRYLIQHFASLLPDPPCAWKVGIHMIRIVASPSQCGKPAPEGVHRDGHRYVAQVLIRRTRIIGGESSLFANDGALLFTKTLTDALDSILLDDTRLLHGVSAIQVAIGEVTGIRDMLLLDFNHLGSAREHQHTGARCDRDCVGRQCESAGVCASVCRRNSIRRDS